MARATNAGSSTAATSIRIMGVALTMVAIAVRITAIIAAPIVAQTIMIVTPTIAAQMDTTTAIISPGTVMTSVAVTQCRQNIVARTIV
jgi:hypothetical protein